MATYEVTYFQFPGRAEPIKMILEVGNVPYVFHGITFQDWPSVKHSTRYGQIPFVKKTGDSEFELYQSLAIARFFAKESGLYPTDNYQAAQSDEYVNVVKDTVDSFYKAFFGPNKDEDVKNFYSTTLPNVLKALESQVKSTGYLVGSGLTWADIYLFDLLNGIGKDTDLKDYPKISALKQVVANNEKIDAYLKSDRNLRK
ncbi:hypothetical protein ABK040_011352 [Willaertia magna]